MGEIHDRPNSLSGGALELRWQHRPKLQMPDLHPMDQATRRLLNIFHIAMIVWNSVSYMPG